MCVEGTMLVSDTCQGPRKQLAVLSGNTGVRGARNSGVRSCV